MRYYATLGPACCEASALAALLRRGVSGFRLNVSHTMLAARRDWIDALHDAERSTGLAAQLMIDLRGPEVRIGALPSPLTLTAGIEALQGGGLTVLLDDGAMALTVLDGGRCRVTRGGVLTGHKSLTPEGTDLHRPALCEADLADLAQAAALGVSAVMQPFVRSADDLRTVRQAMAENGLAHAELFAKVEDQTGLDALPDWMDLCDVVTIARGDLGSSLPLEQLPAAQTVPHLPAQHVHHPGGHGLAVGPGIVSSGGLIGMAEGMAEVQHPAPAAVPLVPGHHRRLIPAAARHQPGKIRLLRRFQVVQNGLVADDAALDDLRHA